MLLNILIQITQATNEAAQAAANSEKSIPVFNLIMKGGLVMVPIFLLLTLALYVMFQKFLMVQNAGKLVDGFSIKLNQMILNGQISEAKMFCSSVDSPIARMLGKGVSRIGRPIKDIEAAMEGVAKIELAKLEKNLAVLHIVSGIAPMFGFIGTIIGVISIFYDISLVGVISIGGVADGLYQKMVTSAAGLIVGIISHVGYHIVNLRLDSLMAKMESEAFNFLDLLQDNK